MDENERREFQNYLQLTYDIHYNPFDILNVSLEDEVDKIKKNYHILSMKYHPDKNVLIDDKEVIRKNKKKYEKVQRSYEILKDKKTQEEIQRIFMDKAKITKGLNRETEYKEKLRKLFIDFEKGLYDPRDFEDRVSQLNQAYGHYEFEHFNKVIQTIAGREDDKLKNEEELRKEFYSSFKNKPLEEDPSNSLYKKFQLKTETKNKETDYQSILRNVTKNKTVPRELTGKGKNFNIDAFNYLADKLQEEQKAEIENKQKQNQGFKIKDLAFYNDPNIESYAGLYYSNTNTTDVNMNEDGIIVYDRESGFGNDKMGDLLDIENTTAKLNDSKKLKKILKEAGGKDTISKYAKRRKQEYTKKISKDDIEKAKNSLNKEIVSTKTDEQLEEERMDMMRKQLKDQRIFMNRFLGFS